VCFGVVRGEESLALLALMQKQGVPSGRTKVAVAMEDSGKLLERFT
jgi:hypothetical protein